jgi:hypothetical protein
MIEAYEIDQMDRIRRVRDKLDQEMLEIPLVERSRRPIIPEYVPSVFELELDT